MADAAISVMGVRVPIPVKGEFNEALDWIAANQMVIRRDNGDMD